MAGSVLVPLAEGFEEIEAVTVIDVLRRAGIDVLVAGIGSELVRGSHGISVQADTTLDKCVDRSFRMVVLPGGMPGAANLAGDLHLEAILERHYEAGKPMGAICASPALVLAPRDMLPKGPVACFPTFRSRLDPAQQTESRVVETGRLITAVGPGAALEFALILAAHLAGKGKANELSRAMQME